MCEAMFARREADGRIRCLLCPRHCLVGNRRRGYCRVRENRAGRLVSLCHRRPAALGVDPIEKKPLFHYLPGSRTLSLGTAGCNFHCLFCQNSALSQPSEPPSAGRDTVYLPPAETVARARGQNCASLAFTYNEPTVFFEYMLETAAAATAAGLGTVMVSNGYIEAAPLRQVAPYISAANIDLKSSREDFYRRLCDARLAPVLATLDRLRAGQTWLEVTTLVIPGENDSDAELTAIARHLVRALGPDTPWHVSRFFPCYRLTGRPPTPAASLQRARAIGRAEGLRFVYPGNLPTDRDTATDCPSCGARLVTRGHPGAVTCRLADGRCPACALPLPGRFAPG